MYSGVPLAAGDVVVKRLIIHIWYGHVHIFNINWAALVQFIICLTTFPIPLQPRVCLLGLVEPLANARAIRTLLGCLIFYARKGVILKWKLPAAPSLDYWRSLVNSVIPLCKATYLSWGWPKKSNKVWDLWVDSTGTTYTILECNIFPISSLMSPVIPL